VGDITSRASAATLVATLTIACVVLLIVSGLPSAGEEAFSSAVAAITVIMLFVIQHTQSRQQIVTQLKLDELIRTSPADDLFMHLEAGEDDELIERESDQIALHDTLRESGADPERAAVSDEASDEPGD